MDVKDYHMDAIDYYYAYGNAIEKNVTRNPCIDTFMYTSPASFGTYVGQVSRATNTDVLWTAIRNFKSNACSKSYWRYGVN